MKRINEKFNSGESKDVKFKKNSDDLINITSEIIEENYFLKVVPEKKISDTGLDVESIKKHFLPIATLSLQKKKNINEK